jgi:deoxycytidylate deaminase
LGFILWGLFYDFMPTLRPFRDLDPDDADKLNMHFYDGSNLNTTIPQGSVVKLIKTTGARPRLSWQQTAINLACDIAGYRSEDPYVQVGAVIIKHNNSIVLGYNGAPPGIEINWLDRDQRRERVIHAEENALDNIRFGEAKIMAVSAMPCKGCVRKLAQKGVRTVYYAEELKGYDNSFAKQLAQEFKIELIQLSPTTKNAAKGLQ